MPDFDRVIRYVQIDSDAPLPITLDGSNEGLAIVSRRNPALGNVSRMVLQKDGSDVTTGTLAGAIPAGSAFQIQSDFYVFAENVDFQGAPVGFDHTFGIAVGGTTDLVSGAKALTAYILASSVQAILDDQWLLAAAARNPALPSDKTDGLPFTLSAPVATSGDHLGALGEIMDNFTPLSFTDTISDPPPTGGFRIGEIDRQTLFPGIDSSALTTGDVHEIRSAIDPPLGTALVRLRSSIAEGTADGSAVQPIRFAGPERTIGTPAWARLEDETLSETVDDEGQLQQIAESTWTINRSVLANTANLVIDDASVVWAISGIERLDRITDRIVCRRAVT